MAFRVRRTSVFWVAIAGALFVASGLLTAVVTGIEPDPIAAETYLPEKSLFQMAAVFTTQPVDSANAYEYSVIYSDAVKDGTARVTFFVRPADGPVILISSPSTPPTCYMVDEFRAADPPGSQLINAIISEDAETHQNVYTLMPIWPKPDAAEQIVRCYVPSLAHYESFTGRVADFYFDKRTPPGMETAKPVPSLLYRFTGIVHARDLGFRGGIELSEGRDARETSRVLEVGSFMSVHWEAAGRQSLRDTLLIIIGTLIGIAVTALIEGVRPYIEGLDRPKSPAEGAAVSPSTRPTPSELSE
jgi:hypothetical protein